MIRTNDVLGTALERTESRGRALSCLGWSRVRETYRRHRTGETDAAEELYRLVTVLESPIAARILDA